MSVELNYKLLGKRLRAIRKERGLSQEQLSEMAGISPQHCCGIERGTAKVSLPTLVKLCDALGATVDQILFDSVSAATKSGLLREVEKVFADTSADEIFLMLSSAKAIKEAVRAKGLLSAKE